VHKPRPSTIAQPLWALRVVSALLLCLLAWARPSLPTAWQGGPSRPAAFVENEIKAAPGRATNPSFEAEAKNPRAEQREPGVRGCFGPCLPAPGVPLLAGPGVGAALTASAVATPAGRRPPRRQVARGPPASPLAC
jgi:hypothetical protein